ncbi:MAG: SWIM zinc finger family protein [Nocardioides sp.]
MSSLPHSDVVSHPPVPQRRGAARASTWWGKAWVRAVEEAAYGEAELRAARSLARAAAVGGISIGRGRMVAAVSDSSGLFTVDVRLPVLDEPATAGLIEAVAAEAGRVGALLSGDLPHALVEHAEEAGAELLPFGGEFEATCTCDAWLDPCAHALALLYQVAWLVDVDPIALCHLRGVPRDLLLARLHAREATVTTHEGTDAVLLDTAFDAVARAQRLLELLETDASVDHLF